MVLFVVFVVICGLIIVALAHATLGYGSSVPAAGVVFLLCLMGVGWMYNAAPTFTDAKPQIENEYHVSLSLPSDRAIGDSNFTSATWKTSDGNIVTGYVERDGRNFGLFVPASDKAQKIRPYPVSEDDRKSSTSVSPTSLPSASPSL